MTVIEVKRFLTSTRCLYAAKSKRINGSDKKPDFLVFVDDE